jgi:4-amino-4-deoxychorismate lyase
VIRLFLTRGLGQGRPPTALALLSPVPAEVVRQRTDGISVITLGLGVPAAFRSHAPWLLGGAKTLSYAVNMASMRWGTARGLDEVLWVSADGYALEAPTASLVWLDGDELCTVQPDRAGILAGITARWLLDHAGDLGWKAAERLVRPGELAGMDGAWLTSSVRGVVAIRELDGAPVAPSSHTSRLQDLIGYPI